MLDIDDVQRKLYNIFVRWHNGLAAGRYESGSLDKMVRIALAMYKGAESGVERRTAESLMALLQSDIRYIWMSHAVDADYDFLLSGNRIRDVLMIGELCRA